MSRACAGDAVEEAVEDGGPVGLVVVSGVVALAEQDGDEGGSGLEVGAGILSVAIQEEVVELDRKSVV